MGIFAGYYAVQILCGIFVYGVNTLLPNVMDVMKYVGATNGFIRLPFFVEGMAAGLISALIASVLVLGGYWVLTYYSDLVPGFWRSLLSESVVPVSKVWYKIVPVFAGFSVLMGGVGSLVSIRKHLNV